MLDEIFASSVFLGSLVQALEPGCKLHGRWLYNSHYVKQPGQELIGSTC